MSDRQRRLAVVGLMALAAATLAACGGPKLPEGPRTVPDVPAPYLIKVGDSIGVRFYKTPELNVDVPVRSDGRISVPPLGDVQAAGRSPEQLAAFLTEQFAKELTEPKVTVMVLNFGGSVYVSGEVKTGGTTAYTNGLSALQAISAAGGFADGAKPASVILIRREQGQYRGYRLALDKVLSGADPEADVRLEPGDILVVPRTWIADADLFVKQWVRDLMPIQPILPAF
ncbi:MAG: polysaccharide biosynthesis/export family protein [Candidatus Binatia bacterium]